MKFLDSLTISSTGLSAQRLRMNLISSNLANANTTRTETGEPYKRKDVIFKAAQGESFQEILDESTAEEGHGVEVAAIIEDELHHFHSLYRCRSAPGSLFAASRSVGC